MSRYYRIAYALRLTPWELTHPAQHVQIEALLELEERGRQAPYGPALDLGAGSGVWSVVLAARGWQITGVDNNVTAIRRASARARRAGVAARFVLGDVTHLARAGIPGGHTFVLDLECFNHLDPASRTAVGHQVTAVTQPGATMLILTWKPGRRGPLPHGASRDDIQAAYPDWQITHEEDFTAAALPAPLKALRPRYHTLQRR